MRWCVMQSMKYGKWVLAVMSDDFARYQVTDIRSDDVNRMVRYADYMNGKIPPERIADKTLLERLDSMKERYKDFSCI